MHLDTMSSLANNRAGSSVSRAMRWFVLVLAACAHAPTRPIAVTYLGVARLQLEADAKVILTDPYFSRPANADAPLVPDVAAISAHAPAHADLIVVGHSHYDHLLDAPTV